MVKLQLEVTDGGAFAKMSPTEQDDPEIVQLAVAYSASFFKNASSNVRQNQKLTLDLLPDHASLMYYVPDNLKQDPVFMLKAMAVNYKVLYYADWLIANNPSFLYKAVRVHERAIGILPRHLVDTIAHETQLAAVLYLYARAKLPFELCKMVVQMQ